MNNEKTTVTIIKDLLYDVKMVAAKRRVGVRQWTEAALRAGLADPNKVEVFLSGVAANEDEICLQEVEKVN